MAHRSYAILFLFMSQVVLAVASDSLYTANPSGYMANPSGYLPNPSGYVPTPSICLRSTCEREMKEVLYVHDIHPPRADHNLVVSVELLPDHGFGSITVNNWTLLDAPQPTGNLIATARGTGVNTDPVNGFIYQNSFSILFGSGSKFPGSTLQVMGLNSVGEWAIVGGTGELTFARGVIKYEAVQSVINFEYYQKISIYALYTPPSVTGNLFP